MKIERRKWVVVYAVVDARGRIDAVSKFKCNCEEIAHVNTECGVTFGPFRIIRCVGTLPKRVATKARVGR